MFEALEEINKRPKPFQFYTASDLWNDAYTSKQMLSYHLNENVDMSSRNMAFIDRSVKWVTSEFKIGPASKIADFGCGPGLYTTRLAKQGAKVTGIDFSERSIRYAKETSKQEQLDINYVNQNYLEFETEERFDLILMIMCDFCALSPAQREKMLNRFNTMLKPGGAVLLDVYSLAAFDRREEAAVYEVNQLNGFWAPDKYYGFVNTFKYDEEKVMLDKYTIVEPGGTREIYNWLTYFTPENIENEFSRAGFQVKEFYSDVSGTPYETASEEFAVIAAKP